MHNFKITSSPKKNTINFKIEYFVHTKIRLCPNKTMNLGSKCCQVLKLVGNVSSRNYRICTASRTFAKTRLRLIDGRKLDKRLSPFLETQSRFLWATPSSRSAQKNDDKSEKVEEKGTDEFANLGLFARFKKMYKEYWYVLVPVHIATSAVWLGSFYYASKR